MLLLLNWYIITFRSINTPPIHGPVKARDVNEVRTLEADAEARTLEAEARTLEAKTEAKAEFV